MKAARVHAPAHEHEHEHEFEPEHGLPEALPAGERVLWQGSPDWHMLARRAFHVRKLVVYFGALVLLRLALMTSGQATAAEMLLAAVSMVVLGATAIGLLALMAWLSARAAVYTITDKRVVMRVGIVLTLTFNIPFKRIASAGLRLDAHSAGATGDLPLVLNGQDRIAWLNLWPHARPWRLARPEPMLRCVPDAAQVAGLLAQAWSAHTGLSAAAPGVAADRGEHHPDNNPHRARPAMAGQ